MTNTKLFLSLAVLSVWGWGTVASVRAEEGGKGPFVYSQQKLNRVKEKSVRYKVAVGNFQDPVEIPGSPFNKPDAKADENTQTYNVNIATPNLVRPPQTDVNRVTGMLTDLLTKTEKFDVVERQEVNQLIREIKFEGMEWVQKESARKLGNIYGVKYILLGDVLPNYAGEEIGRGNYTATLRLVEVATGVVVSTGTGQRNQLREALADAVKILAGDLEGDRWTCRVVRVDGKDVYINAGLDDKLRKNDVFALVRPVDPIADPATGRVLGKKETEIARIKVVEVLERDLSLVRSLNKEAVIKEGDIVSAKRAVLRKDTEKNLWRKIFGRSPVER